MKKVSSSFVTGAIALVFAVLGYQSALLVHYSALSAITASRDAPDTVYVRVSADEGAGKSIADSGRGGRVERKNSAHSGYARAVRESVPPRRVSNFDFDPNSVSVEQLVMLGFSPKQAQSIDNYRSKGGRFRTKEDFARSYVVADSVFRRLEPYIQIPKLDINAADSAAFDSLPGIGPYFAAKMVEYREKLGGYSNIYQLKEIYNFTQEKFDALKDMIEVGEKRPYPLWTLPADSLRLHPYIRQAGTARAIVLFREHNPRSEWTVEALGRAGILSEENAARLSSCFIENP